MNVLGSWLRGFNACRGMRLALIGMVIFVFGVPVCSVAAPPVITNITILPGKQVELQLVVEVGQSYTFEISTDAVNWEAVAGIENAPTNFLVVVDDESTDRSPARFYRMKVGRYTRLDFGFMHFVHAGQFSGGGSTPAVSYPLSFSSYSAIFEAEGDAPYPLPSQVFFTGPAGSGLSSTPADAENSDSDESGSWYYSPTIAAPAGALSGAWTVTYRGTNVNFTSDIQPLSRLVVPVPTVVIANGLLQSVSWVYRDRVTGELLTGPPSYMRNCQLQVEGIDNGRLYDSPYDGDPAITNHVLTSPVTWSNVQAINMVYDDTDEDHYVIFFMRQ